MLKPEDILFILLVSKIMMDKLYLMLNLDALFNIEFNFCVYLQAYYAHFTSSFLFFY